MSLNKSLLLASITLVSITVADAQQSVLFNQPQQGAAAGQLDDPFAAPAPANLSAAPSPSPTPAMLQAQVEALAFGSPAGTVAVPPAGFPAPPASAARAPTLAPAVASPAPGFVIAAPAPVAAVAPAANPFAPAATPAPSGAAQGAFDPGLAQAEAATPVPTNKTDETALRYYASQRDLVRVGAEIRRLKTLYPNWQPPSDLFAPRSTADEQPLWDIYAKGDYAAVRRAIDAIRATKPNWAPSEDLATKLDDGEARQKVNAAASAGNWQGVIASAQARSGLLVCANMDVLWNVGEGFARTGNMAQAFDLYAYVLSHCDKPEERLATFQKANALLPPKGTDALVSYGRTLPNGQGEFDGLRFDRLRQQMADVASGASSQLPPVEELTAYANFVRSSRSASDMGLVGWYFFGQQNWSRAAEWFRAGIEAGGDAKLTEGYVLSLRNDDKIAEAETFAYRNHRLSPELSKIYIEMVADELTADEASNPVDSGLMDRFQQVVAEAKSPLGAQAIGWRLVHEEEFPDAQEWFARSVKWKPTEEGVVGLAVVATRLKQNAALKDVQNRFQKDFPALADFKDYVPPTAAASRSTRQAQTTTVKSSNRPAKRGARSGGGDSLMAEANRLFKSGDYQGTLAVLDKREAQRGKEYGAQILRGWANHKLGRWEQARQVFKEQDKKRSTRDTRFGLGATSNSQYRMWN